MSAESYGYSNPYVMELSIDGIGWMDLPVGGVQSQTLDLDPGTYNYTLYFNDWNIDIFSATVMIGDIVLESYNGDSYITGTFTIEETMNLLSPQINLFVHPCNF